MAKKVIKTILRTPYGNIDITNKKISTSRIKSLVVSAIAQVILEAHSFAKEYTSNRFDMYTPAIGKGELTKALKRSYLQSLEASQVVRTSTGFKAGFFNYDTLNQGLDVGEYNFQWWKIHEFGSPSGSTPLVGDGRVFKDRGAFIRKEGSGFFGEGFFLSRAEMNRRGLDGKLKMHPGVKPIRNLVTLGPQIKEFVIVNLKSTLPQVVARAIAGD